MTYPGKSQLEILVEKLDKELIARGTHISVEDGLQFTNKEGTPLRESVMKQVRKLYLTAPPLNQALRHISTGELVKLLIIKSQELNRARGIWNDDNRRDVYRIREEKTKTNAASTAAICRDRDLTEEEKGYSSIKVKNYGETFNLCVEEPFRHQPIAAGRLFSGVLVKGDIIATAGHCADEKSVTELRIIFGFKMLGLSTSVTWIPNEDIYKGIEIIGKTYNRSNGSDWALVKLDRKVKDHPVAKLSEKPIYLNQPVYVLGHPCGLPLKYSAGAQVRGIDDSFFSADLNVYCGNSGSPVFDRDTHEVIGLVARGDSQDFRWTGKGWLSIIYPHPMYRSKEPQCTRVSEFIKYCR